MIHWDNNTNNPLPLTMFSTNKFKHAVIIAFILSVAFLVNSSFYFFTGIPLKYQQSSDATVHVVDWQRLAQNYSGGFENDLMFQNYQAQPTGVLFVDKILVGISDTFNIELLNWSIMISYIFLAVFLTGVYFLVLYSTKNLLLATTISLVSIIPVISLGLSSWGFLTKGFVPKEISLGIAVWLSIIYVWGVSTNSKRKVGIFFLLLGLFSNWYPVLFFHYAIVLLVAEVIRQGGVKKQHFLYGLVFLAAAPIALFDIFIKSSNFTPPVNAIIVDHYAETLRSWKYLFLHYLRKQIVYIAIVAFLWYIYRHILKKEYPPLITLWYAIWWSALVWSLLGVGIEIFAPSYMKYLLSRTSVWFYFASMIIVGYTAYEIWFTKYARSTKNSILFSVVLSFILLAQSSVLNVYKGIEEGRDNSQDYQQYLSILTQLKTVIPPGSVILSNPDKEAKTIRAYGGVGSYVSWKDGNVTLFDGDAATIWFNRYKETQRVFLQKDFSEIQDLATKHNLQFYLFDKRDIESGLDALSGATILESGEYGLAQFK